MKNNDVDTEVGPKETSRLEGFSDGVFAIAITLLILDLIQVVKEKNDEGLLTHLFNYSNAFLAFAIGFLTILICWINHHLVFTYINKVNSTLMWVNGFVLSMVTFTPFATATLSEYFYSEPHTAIAIFGFNFFMISVAAYGLSAYVYNRHLIKNENREPFYYFKRLYQYSIFYTFIILFICFISVSAAIFFYCILFIVFAYPKEFSIKLSRMRLKKNR